MAIKTTKGHYLGTIALVAVTLWILLGHWLVCACGRVMQAHVFVCV